MVSINDAKNLLVDWLNKKQSTNVQTNVLKKSATNTKDTGVKLPNSTASTNLKTWTKNKLQEKGMIQPTTTTTTQNKQTKQQILDNNSTAQKLKQLSLQNNVNYVANQQNQGSRFIGFQNNNQTRPLTDLAGNIIQENLDAKRKSEFDRILSKPILNIPTKKSEIEEYNKKEKERYRTDEQVIKDFHYDVRNSNGTLTKEQISQLYPEFQGKEDIALMLQADLLPLVQNDEFADMKKLAEIYPELLSKQKKVGDQILKDQEKQGKEIKDLAKKAEKTLSRYNVLSKNGQQYMEDVYQIGNYVDMIRAEYRLPGNPSDIDIINFGKQNIPEVKEILDDMERLKSNYNLTERDRDIILNNGFDIGEWLYQAGADIQNFTQHNQLGDYLDKKSSTWERQLSNLGINGGSANTIANLPKKAVNTAEIPVNMVGDLSSGLGKVGIATERIATQQNRNEDGTTDMNGITQDLIKGGGGALSVAFNTVMAIPTALFHLAEDTDAGSAAIDGTLGKMQKELDNLQSGKTTNSDNAFTQWYNGLDEEAKADLLNEEIMAIFHFVHKGGGKVKKVGSFEIKSAKNAINDVIRQKYSIESNNANFKAKVEQGLADGTMKVTDDGKLTDRDGNNIGKVKVHKIKTKDKIKYVVDKVISDNRAARNAKSLGELNPNALPDNRTFREKSEEKAYNAGVKTREIYDTAKEGIDTVKKGVKSINVGNAVKGTSEMVGKGVKATSDLYNKGKNAVTQGKNAVTNAVKENVVEPFKKGYEGVKETVNENIVEPYNKGRGTNEFNKKSFNQGQQLQESNSTSEINNKVNGDNYTQKNTNSKKLNKVQLKLLQNNNRMNPKSIDTFKEWYGEDYGQYMYDRGFTKSADGGNLDDMENYKNSLLSQKRETLNKIEGTYQDISLQDMAEHLVEKAENVRNRKLLKEAQELQNKHNETGLTMPEADRLRTLFQQNIKMGFHQDIPADARERAKNEYMAVKDFLDDVGRKNGFDDLDNINREIQKTQHIIKGIESKLNRESANNAYTLTDYILMAEAFTSPQTAAVFTAKQVLKNPKVRSAGLNVAVGGRGNAKNRVTAGSREKTNENVESIAGAKRKQKEMGLSEAPALPNGIKLSKVTEIDKRKPSDTTPPTENTPTEKVEKTAPKKKSESKPKNKVTSKKSEVTEGKETPKAEKQLETRVENKQPEPKGQAVNPDNIITYGSDYVLDNMYGQKSLTNKNGKTVKSVQLKYGIKKDNLDISKLTRPPEGVDFMHYEMYDGTHIILDKNGNVYELVSGFDDVDSFFNGIVKKGESGLDADVIERLEGHNQYMKSQGWTLKDTYDQLLKSKNDIISGVAKPNWKKLHKDFVDFIEGKNKPKNAVTAEKAGVTTKSEPETQTSIKGDTIDEVLDIVNNKKQGRFVLSEETQAGVVNSFMSTNIQLGGYANQIMFLNEGNTDRMTVRIERDNPENYIDKINRVLEGLGLQYRVVKTATENKGFGLKNLNTGNVEQFKEQANYWDVTKKLKDTQIVPRRTAEQQAEYEKALETQRAIHRTHQELGDLKKDIAKNEQRAAEAKLKEKRAGVQSYVDENYPKGIARTKAMQELTKTNKDAERNSRLSYWEGFPENYNDMELWELLDILGKQDNWKINEVREREYVDKAGEHHDVYSYWYRLNDKQDAKGIHHADYSTHLSKYERDYLSDLKNKKELEIEKKDMKEHPENYASEEQLKSLFKEGGTTVKTSNRFGLKEQKGSSRINNFTNVVKRIIDKYEGEIDNTDTITIEKEPYLPLQISKLGNELIVRHINLGYDDPAMKFQILDNGKLHVTGIKQAFMEQVMGIRDWSTDIKDTDELLHVRAVNLEDQFLGERNIDEDTGVMKERTDNKDNTATKINNIKSFDDIKNLLNPTKAGAVSDWEYEGELNGVKTRVWNYGDTIFIKYGEGQGPAQARIDMADSDHIDQLKELLSEINNDGEILESNRNNPFNTKTTTEITGEKNIVTAKTVAKSENVNIIGKNNSLTTKNPINDKGGEKGNGDSEGQKQLSNSEGVLGESEGGRQGVSDKNSTSGGEKTLMSSGDNNKESGSGLTNGGTHKSIRTKGDNVITAKTVTQARDTNRECVNILEKHKYSTNPADYTAEEIETLRQYEGRGGVNDKEDMNTQGALNQYYTKDNIIKAMWRLLDGYNNTDILEPSMGVGRFFMYAPEGSNLAGFEYDKIPGTIAKILYPNADIKIGDFQDNFMLGGKRSVGEYYNGKKYDIVIGNPPYEERQGRQMGLGEEPKISRFDDYFIKRGVDMLKPGGHLAFVTSSQFLRGADNYAKQMISQKADLIDAYRIPIGAFDRTGVETDIIVLERKEGGGDSSLLSASKWFDKHPDKVLGEERNDIKGRFGLKTGVVGDLAEIDNIAQAHLGSDGKPANLEVKFTPNKTEPKVDTEKPKNVVTATKKTAITQKSQPKVKAPKQEIKEGEWTDWTMDKKDDNGNITKVPIGKSYMGVLFKGIPGQETGKLVVGKGGIGKYQNVLNSNGKIGDPSITLESDREGLNYINGELEPNILYATGNIPNKLAQLEADYNANRIDEQQYNKQKDLLEQALPEPIDFQDIDRNPYSDWVLDTETESLATVWKNSEEGYVDKKQTIRELFKTYISGKDKELGTVSVKKVKKNGDIDFEHQSLATAMIKVLEKQGRGFAKEMEDELTVRMPEEFSKFMKSEIDDTTKQRLQDEFNRKFNNYKNFDYSELGYTIDDVSAKGHWTPSDVQSRGVARILTTESLIVAYGVGQGKTFTGAEGAIASMQQGKATKCLIVVPIGTKSDWMRTIAENNPNQEIVDLGTLAPGSGARERLSAAFGHDPRNWIKPGQIGILVDSALGKQISFKPDTLQFLQEKLTDVTNTPFSRETEVDKLKKQKEELEAENNDYYISNAQLEKNKKKLEKITGELESIESNKVDYGMIVRRYSGKALPDEGISTALDHVYEDYDEYLDNMNKYLDEHEDIDREKALKILNKIYDNERPIYLEELGIDHLTVDEAHNYRNLFNKSVDDDEEGGGGWRASVDISKGSAVAMNLYGMSQYIMEKNNGGNVILLTATPFINEPSEVYNMLSYVGKNGMEEMGIENMDDFFDTYVGLTNKLLIKPSGTDVTNKNVMLQFNNTRALINSLLDRYIDYEGESDLIVKPRQNTYPVRLKMGSRQEEIQKKLEVQIDENNFDDVWQGEPIYVTTKDGDTVTLASTRKVDDKGKTKGAVIEGMGQANSDLISPYLTKYNKNKLSEVTPKELIDTSPKLKAVVEIIKATRQSGINRGVFVYMPIGTELHELLQKAIELENPGIKVGIINGESKYADMTKTQAEKLGLGDPKGARARETGKKFSDGEIDVLIGGENTKEGLNLQGNGYITIEVSQPRNPNDRTQLHGRVWRKGNKSNEVLVIPLLMENSSDIYRFQRMQHKNSRWSLLESLAAYKRGEDIDNLKPQEDMNLEEQKLALFTEPERKAKVSITMDKAELSNQLQKLDGSIQGLEGVLKTMESWGSTRGQYKDYAHNDPYKVLKDGTGKDITTNILDENALEPLQQKLDYYHDKAAKSYAEQHPEWNKAQIENAIKKESPYNSDASNYNYTKRFEMAQARGERNAVVRQMNAIGLKSIDELKSYLENLHNEKELLERKIRNIENTKQERIEKYRREIEENKANALDLEDIIEDLKEEFKHQITFKTEGELRDWLKVTENLPKRNVAKSKSDIQHGLNKYSWKSEDYVGIKPKNTEIRKNKVTSQFAQYTDENKKPEFEFNRFVPKQRITKEDGTWLTKIGYQNKLRKGLKDVLRKEKSASIKAEHSGKTMEEELKGDKFYETWISRIMGNITRLAEENAFEIIQAYESDHPELIGDTTPENFLDYVNDYKIENGKEDKIPDKFAIEGAEILSDKYQEYLDTGEIKEGTKNKVTGNGKNKITNG